MVNTRPHKTLLSNVVKWSPDGQLAPLSSTYVLNLDNLSKHHLVALQAETAADIFAIFYFRLLWPPKGRYQSRHLKISFQ